MLEACAPSRDSSVVRTATRSDGRRERLTFTRTGAALLLGVSPAVAPWIVRVRLPRGQRLRSASIGGVRVAPLVLDPATKGDVSQGARAGGSVPFGAPGEPVEGATVVELRLRVGEGSVEMQLEH